MLHKTLDLLIRQRTVLINALRGHIGEYGIVAARGPAGVRTALASVRGGNDGLPPSALAVLEAVADPLAGLDEAISGLERRILARYQASETSRRLATIPGIGPITATAIAATVPDSGQFRSGRQFAAWLGLTPRANSSGGNGRQGGISRAGDGYVRRLMVMGATAVLRFARQRGGGAWITGMIARNKPKVAAVAVANKSARIACALMARGEVFTPRPA